MLRTTATAMMLAAPAMAEGLDCTVMSRCFEGQPCKTAEILRIEIRPAEDHAYRFALVDGPEFTARREVIGSMTRFTTDPVFDLFWSLVTVPEGTAMASVAGVVGGFAMYHFVGRCEAA